MYRSSPVEFDGKCLQNHQSLIFSVCTSIGLKTFFCMFFKDGRQTKGEDLNGVQLNMLCIICRLMSVSLNCEQLERQTRWRRT